MFDRAYLQKAEAALEDQLHDGKFNTSVNRSKISSAPVPKLKPPKFVSREEVSLGQENNELMRLLANRCPS